RCNKRARQSRQNWASRGTQPANGRSRLAVMVTLTNTSQKTQSLKLPSCAVKIRSCETPTNCSRLHRLFRSGTRPQTSEMIQFIDNHRDCFSIEFVCVGR